MTSYIAVFVGVLLCMYLGQVLGLMIRCDNNEDFKGIKGYIWLVPFLNVVTFFSILKDCVKTQSWIMMKAFFSVGDKSIMIMGAMVQQTEEIERIRQTNALRLQRKKQLREVKKMQKELVFQMRDCIIGNFRTM